MLNPLIVLRHTPWWVFPLFAAIAWFGVRALKPSTVPIWRLLIVPAIFIGWGISSLVRQSLSSPHALLDWSAAALVFGTLGFATNRMRKVTFDKVHRQIAFPGSPWSLFRNLLNFTIQYGMGVATAIAPAARSDLVTWKIILSGASTGYFLGWLAKLASRYWQAPAVDHSNKEKPVVFDRA